ncbi:hypothetical protein Tco_0828688 [Tanacetum coccineum]
MRILRLREVARATARIALEFAPEFVYVYCMDFVECYLTLLGSYAFSVSLLLTPLCCDDIHDVMPRVSDLAGCDMDFVVPVFSPGDDPIAYLNKAMAFLTVVASSRVTVQQVQGRQGQSYSAWYKEKAMLVETQEAGQILDEEQLHFLTYTRGFLDGLKLFRYYIPNNAAFQTEDLILMDLTVMDLSKCTRVLMLTFQLLSDDFRKRFTPQQELSIEQVFWLRMSNPTSKPSDASPVKIEAPKELPKVSLVNESIKKLKFHLARFDNVGKIRTTPDARTEGVWGFEHTKAFFNNEIIPFLKSLKYIFNVFDKDLLNKIMEVQTVFNQMDVVVQQSSVDKKCLEVAKKELLLEKDRLLQQIMSQDVLLTVMNYMSLIGESVHMDRKRNESCDKCSNLEAELLKSQYVHNDLLKSHSQLEKHCISLELSIQMNQEIFQKDESCNNQNALEILEFFENNDLKAQLLDKDTTICKLKEIIKSIREKSKDENMNYDYSETETKNVELENSVAKLISENERLCNEINHVKQVFKEHLDSINKTRVRTKEQSDSLIDKLNLKSAKNEDLKA